MNEVTGKEEKKPKVFYFSYDIAKKELTELKDFQKEKDIPMWASISPDKQNVVFSRSDYNLYSMGWSDFEKALVNENDSTIVETQLTFDGSYDFPWGGVGRDENNEDIEKNIKKRKPARIVWSPDGKYFAMERSDNTAVDDLWVINSVSSDRPTLETYKYQMAGELNSSISHLMVCEIGTKTFTEIDTDRFKDQTIGISREHFVKNTRDDRIKFSKWLGDNETFYVTVTSRDLKRIDICKVDVKSGEVTTLIEERLNKSLETRTPRPTDNQNEIIHWSERNGWGHLYLYSSDGTLKNAITKGAFHVEEVVGVDSKNRVVYFEAFGVNDGENPYYRHIYSVNFDGSNFKELNKITADNTSILSDNNTFFVNTSSEVDSTPISKVFSNTGKEISTLEETDLSLLFNAGYKFPEKFTVKAGDGITDLYGVMYKPYDFDSTKVYPIIAYVYPGPQTEAVNTQFTTLKWDRIDRLAQLGFIVITVGNRGGHPNRSKWYHTYGYGNLRDYGLEDKVTAIQQLAYRHNFIDINKVGIHGHSGGGFMSTAAMLVYPDFFKVAVSCAGNHENNIYNRWWSEKHHGIDEAITEQGDTTFNYSIDKNSEIAKNLKGKLLVIHGDQDNNVHPGNTIRLVNALIRSNKRFDMLILPGQRHAFGDMTEYFFWRLADYFSEHLIGDCETSTDIPQMNRLEQKSK
ncbi:MAG: DPP IV N-terminal domain-containing protein [Rikenellaceae bacterium]